MHLGNYSLSYVRDVGRDMTPKAGLEVDFQDKLPIDRKSLRRNSVTMDLVKT